MNLLVNNDAKLLQEWFAKLGHLRIRLHNTARCENAVL